MTPEIRERIEIEMRHSHETNCGDWPARFVEAELEEKPWGPKDKGERADQHVIIKCERCGESFGYVGRNPHLKKLCSACIKEKKRAHDKRIGQERKDRRKRGIRDA